jgi:16S rRNA (uracil1498-N3)-methyltransferase
LTSDHFYVEKGRITGDRLILEGREHHHLGRVARCRPGDVVWLFDESGMTYRARVEEIGPEKTNLSILERVRAEVRGTEIKLGQSLIKAKGMDLLVREATELGIAALFPVVAARSVVKVGERADKKVERWCAIAREASKQSKSCLVPRVFPPRPLSEFLTDIDAAVKIVLSENHGRPLREVVLAAEGELPADVVLLVGPEGGWTPAEEKKIRGCGYEAVSLGRSILRAETAALSAVAILSHFWKRYYVSQRAESR